MKKLILTTLLASCIFTTYATELNTQIQCITLQAGIESESDGSMIQVESDGSMIQVESDGSMIQVESDGSMIQVESDGSMIQVESDGSMIQLLTYQICQQHTV